jgi:uncharacterized membrane protein
MFVFLACRFSKALKSSIPVRSAISLSLIIKVVRVLMLAVNICPSKVESKPKSISLCSKALSGIAVVCATLVCVKAIKPNKV